MLADGTNYVIPIVRLVANPGWNCERDITICVSGSVQDRHDWRTYLLKFVSKKYSMLVCVKIKSVSMSVLVANE